MVREVIACEHEALEKVLDRSAADPRLRHDEIAARDWGRHADQGVADVGPLEVDVGDAHSGRAQRDPGVVAREGRRADPASLSVVDRREDERIVRKPEALGNLGEQRTDRLIQGNELRQLLRIEAGPLHQRRMVGRVRTPVIGQQHQEAGALVGHSAPAQPHGHVIHWLEESRGSRVDVRTGELDPAHVGEGVGTGVERRDAVDLHPAPHSKEARLHAPSAGQFFESCRGAALIHPDDHVARGTTVRAHRNDRGVLAGAGNASDLASVWQRDQGLLRRHQHRLPHALCVLLCAAVVCENRLDGLAAGAKQRTVAPDYGGLHVRGTEVDGEDHHVTTSLRAFWPMSSSLEWRR